MIKCQREHVGCFRAICQKQCHYEFNTVFQKSCIIACAKPKEVNPIKLSFSKTNKCFGSTQIYNSQWSIKINWIRASIIQIFFFSSIENIYIRYSILLAQCLSPDHGHRKISLPPISFIQLVLFFIYDFSFSND